MEAKESGFISACVYIMLGAFTAAFVSLLAIAIFWAAQELL